MVWRIKAQQGSPQRLAEHHGCGTLQPPAALWVCHIQLQLEGM